MKNENNETIWSDSDSDTRLRAGEIRLINHVSGRVINFYSSLNIYYDVDGLGNPIIKVEGLDENTIFEIGNSRVIYVIDGETKDITWSYEMSYEDFLNTTGLQGVQTFDDVNSDGKNEIVAFKQRTSDWGSGDEYGEYTRLLVFLGNGSIFYEKPLTDSTYYGVYEQYMKDPSFLSSLNQEEIEHRKKPLHNFTGCECVIV